MLKPVAKFHWEDPLLLDTQLGEDERMVREAAAAYAQDKLAPRVTEAFRHEKTDAAIFREMGEIGLLGPTIPAEYGGPGLNYVAYGLIAREVERVDSGYRSMMSVQSSLVMVPIFEFGTEAQKQKYLPKLATGEWIDLVKAGVVDPTKVTRSALQHAASISGLLLTTDKGWVASFGEATFQVVTIMTTTGYASQDFNTWAAFCLLILFLTMFIGGCAGSTAGAIKVVRIRLLAGVMRRDIETAVHPEAVRAVRVNRKPVGESAIQGATVFAGIYITAWAVGTVLILLFCTIAGTDVDAFNAMTSSATAIGNVGPSTGIAGPFGSFQPYPDGAKITMAALMWIGRLEIIPIFVLFTRAFWRR